MGGVPFQSKGCSTCKSRKIRCDLQQPECARCLKRGLSCPGYSKPRTFVHYQSTKRLVAASQTGVAAAHSSSLGVAQDVPMPLPVNSRPEARSQIFSSFLSAYFPLNTVGLVGADIWYHLFTGFATLPSKTGTSASLLDKSLCALTCVGLGQMKQDQQLIYYGTSLYHATIRHMSSIIQHNTPNEELLYATVIFQRLEPLFAPLGVEAWIAHAEGTNAFLRKCHRDDPQNPLIGSIYQHQKVLGVSDPLKPSEKASKPMSGIYEIYASFKPILAGFKKLNSFNTLESCQSLLQECILHKDNIIAWFANEKPSLGPEPAPYPNFKSTCEHLPSTDEVFGPAYNFPDLKSALNHVMYWTALSLIYPMIYQAKINTMAHAGRTRIIDPNTDQDYMLSWYYADEACRGIPYCLTKTEHIWGAQRAMFPIVQASQVYSNIRWREKFMWCQNAFTAIEHLGFGLAVCLREAALKHWFVSDNAHVISTSAALPFRNESSQRQMPHMEEPVGNTQVSEVVELADDPSHLGSNYHK